MQVDTSAPKATFSLVIAEGINRSYSVFGKPIDYTGANLHIADQYGDISICQFVFSGLGASERIVHAHNFRISWIALHPAKSAGSKVELTLIGIGKVDVTRRKKPLGKFSCDLQSLWLESVTDTKLCPFAAKETGTASSVHAACSTKVRKAGDH